MNKPSSNEWMRDVELSQRNVVFPDTVANEARFWRNLGDRPWTASIKIGMAVLAVFVCAWLGIFLVAARHVLWVVVLGMLLLWGPIFGLLAWAVRRNLRKIQQTRIGRRHSR